MNRNHIHHPNPSVIDQLLEHEVISVEQEHFKNQDIPKGTRKRQIARPLQLPRDRLAVTFQRCRQRKQLSFADLSQISGIDVAHIWRIEQSERPNTSREVLIVLSMAMVLNENTLDQVIEIANEILDAAGLKMLRAPWESKPGPKSKVGPVNTSSRR